MLDSLQTQSGDAFKDFSAAEALRPSRAEHNPQLQSWTALKGERIALFGGSFDPVHKGHIEVALRAAEEFELDRVVFLPTPQNPLKDFQPEASEEERLAMLTIALRGHPNLYVSDFEFNQARGLDYSVEKLELLKEELCSSNQLFFILGSDHLATLHKWKNLDRFCEMLDGLLMSSREELEAGQIDEIGQALTEQQLEKIKAGFFHTESPESSTAIREDGRFEQLPPELRDFVSRTGLYQG